MTDLGELRRIAGAAAKRSLVSTDVKGIEVGSDVNDDGEDLLRIRIVVPDGKVAEVDFKEFFDAILQIKQEVRESGDDRRAMVAFITESELIDLASPQP